MFQDACLGFVNEETNEWEYADECVEENDEGQFCGETDHFTSFAILLVGRENLGSCDSEDAIDKIVAYLSLVSVVFTVVFLGIFFVVAEIGLRIIKHKKKQRFNSMLAHRTGVLQQIQAESRSGLNLTSSVSQDAYRL